MSISAQSLPDARRSRTLRWQPAGYWLVTGALAAELAIGGVWDITRLPYDGPADRWFNPKWLSA